MGTKVKLLLAIPLLFTTSIYAQDAPILRDEAPPRFERLGREEGLSNLSVSSIVQDRNGFLWFGTQGGLNRYDGRSVEVFRHDPFDENTLPHDLIQTIYYQEEEEVLWIGTYNGLSSFDISAGSFTNIPAGDDGISNSVVIAVVSDSRGMIWIGSMGGLDRLDPETGEITSYEVPGDVVRSLHVDARGTLWVGSYTGLYTLDTTDSAVGTKTPTKKDITLPSEAVMDIIEVEPGVLALGCWGGGIVRYVVDSGRVTVQELEDDRVYTLTRTNDGTLWAGTWGGGLFAVESSGRVTRFSGSSEEANLANPIVYSLHQDRSDILWIGTNGGGVQKISPRKRDYRRFGRDPDDPAALPEGKVNVISRDPRGALWFGLYNGGLNRYDDAQNRMITYRHEEDDPASLPNNIVNDIFYLPGYRFLVATNGGIARFDPETGRFELWGRDFNQEAPLPDEIVYVIEEDSLGRLWIGTYTKGVVRYDPETGAMRHFSHEPEDPDSLSDNLIYDIHEDSGGRIWIATNNGLNRYDESSESFRRYRHNPDDRSSISSNTVRSIYEDSAERLWIPTVSGGLSRWRGEGKGFEHILAGDGLASNTVVSILEDELGRLWAATQQGISIINPETGAISTLDENDGLASVEFHAGALRDRNGTLYFGAAHGVTGISESASLRNPHPPQVHISSIEILQRPIREYQYVLNGSSVELSPQDRLISFEFVALEYEAPERNEFYYKLDGFDREWIHAGNRGFASYTALPPGEYTFMVRASNNDGVWSETPATVSLSVEAPLWRRWWAFLIYTLLLLGIVFAAIRLNQGRLVRRQNEQLAAANKELQRLSLHDPLTELYNRRYLDTRLKEELAHARRSGRPVSLLMLDLDRFKEYNDRHGHVAGDAVLVDFARTLQREIQRRTDFACRYGGEEFAIVLYDTDRSGAAEIATRIIEAAREGDVTVSIGVATTGAGKESGERSLLESADAALYEAKAGGRDRYVIAGDS